MDARRVTVCGTVQGVGFRPFVYRLAGELGLAGWVRNDTGGVSIHIEGDPDALERFVTALEREHPPAASIASITSQSVPVRRLARFEIQSSAADGPPRTRISPDLALCDDCLREMRDDADARCGYAYINCTNCGPRYSIIRALPYDRPRTTMAAWPLCPACRAEYEDPTNRRYHAQPVACPNCGPGYRLVREADTVADGPAAIVDAAGLLGGGAILAIKGIGGYHLACDATCDQAVATLRARKFRKEKPFAVMAASLASAERVARLDATHRDLLVSVARPIVLAPARRAMPELAPDTDEIGLMLPYAPLHHLLFDAGAPDPLVLTSANRSNEPIAFDDEDARERLHGIADGFLVGERPIQRRVDDSVVAVRSGRPFMIRRARGYAPASVAALETARPILAVGADLKNTIALATGGEVFVSQHIGDLGDFESDRAFRETIDDLLAMYTIDPTALLVAHDLHPEYASTRIARDLQAAEHRAVQHHEAHIAAVLLEHDLLDQPVVGLALDGTGYGHDGSIWGGEVLVGSVRSGFFRVASLRPVNMPGGDAAARNPVQAAAAYLSEVPPELLEAPPFAFPPRFRQAQALIARGVRCVSTTSTGRVFDAAAALCGFTRPAGYEGHAAIWLEHRARQGWGGAVPLPATLDAGVLLGAVLDARRRGAAVPEIAAGFHAALAEALHAAAVAAARDAGIGTVVCSGGVWQNRLLLDAVVGRLEADYRVVWGERVPVNDGGISAGQVALAARPRS